MKRKNESMLFMTKLQEILPDWTFTLEEWDQYSSDEKSIIKVKVDALQQEILKGE